jgi:hypothetical protein
MLPSTHCILFSLTTECSFPAPWNLFNTVYHICRGVALTYILSVRLWCGICPFVCNVCNTKSLIMVAAEVVVVMVVDGGGGGDGGSGGGNTVSAVVVMVVVVGRIAHRTLR